MHKLPSDSDDFRKRLNSKSGCGCVNCIIPPHMFRELMKSRDKDTQQAALTSWLETNRLRGERKVRSLFAGANAAAGGSRRTVFDCRRGTDLSQAVLARSEDGPESKDESVNLAFDGLGKTRDFYRQILNRDSIDDQGMRLNGYVHRGERYNNAFWDGQEMVFGDGDGHIFTNFTKSLDVIAHELTHGVTENTAALEYHGQSGALNESISDVFGSLVKQWSLHQTADQADWLIGAEVFTPGIDADGLRSMKAPGTAYDNQLLGRDPQPDHMDRYVNLPDTDDGDYGGVHINSGIPNKAFYLTAVGIGGHAWEAAGRIWYDALRASEQSTQFQAFADTTYGKAGELFGTGGGEQQAVLSAWREVGVQISGVMGMGGRGRVRGGGAREADSYAGLAKQIEGLAAQLKALSKEVSALKKN